MTDKHALRVILALSMLIFAIGAAANSRETAEAPENMMVYYFHRPPYYIHEKDGHTGLLVDIARRVFKQADIACSFRVSNPMRILSAIQGRQAVCSVGWFMLEERRQFAKFSLPIYRDKPMGLLLHPAARKQLPETVTIEAVFAAPLTGGIIEGFSYGTWLDGKIAALGPKLIATNANSSQLARMIAAHRFDYTFIAPEEADYLLRGNTYFRNHLCFTPIEAAPAGNYRYLMFSRTVSDNLIQRVNAAIRDLKLVD